MKIGILGGTFNPPHIGHCILAQEMLDTLCLDKIFFIPTNISPHKKGAKMVPSHHRYAMVELMVKDNPQFSVIDYEIAREGVSYTVETLEYLKKQYPLDRFYLIIGSDLACEFGDWRQPQRIKELAQVVVARRREFPSPGNSSFLPVDILQIDISSSCIRRMRKNNLSIRYLVAPGVGEYIHTHKLYLI
ncbi:MAG: nicotinate (nicotinamide) nucleotide adenylyltransferase [Candidatus Omnitrophica bacterium]|nr:nicotinate (nicotinamide) nucleotide adenylyltransferase [Candidatus Omnitrophota bacterium]